MLPFYQMDSRCRCLTDARGRVVIMSRATISIRGATRETVRNMLLAIDVGNTQTVVGIYQDGSLQYRWRVATNKSHTSDELRVKLVPLLASEA